MPLTLDLRISIREKGVFACFHPEAAALFNVCSDLKRVCWTLYKPEIHLEKSVRGTRRDSLLTTSKPTSSYSGASCHNCAIARRHRPMRLSPNLWAPRIPSSSWKRSLTASASNFTCEEAGQSGSTARAKPRTTVGAIWKHQADSSLPVRISYRRGELDPVYCWRFPRRCPQVGSPVITSAYRAASFSTAK